MATAHAPISAPVSFSLKNILLATDFSTGSQTALKYARALAREKSLPVYALHVNGPNSCQLLSPEALAITFDRFHEDSNLAPELLHNLMSGLPTEVPLHQGRIWEVMEDVISRNQIDLVVQATHGRNGLDRDPRFRGGRDFPQRLLPCSYDRPRGEGETQRGIEDQEHSPGHGF